MPAVTVHRCILAARSGFFRALLEGGMGDAKEDELILRVTVGFVFVIWLIWLHTINKFNGLRNCWGVWGQNCTRIKVVGDTLI